MNSLTQKFCGECGRSFTNAGAVAQSSTAPKPPPVSSSREDIAIRPRLAGVLSVEEPPRARFPLPLVGRDDDLAWLEDRRVEARTSLCAARVVGDAGM